MEVKEKTRAWRLAGTMVLNLILASGPLLATTPPALQGGRRRRTARRRPRTRPPRKRRSRPWTN